MIDNLGDDMKLHDFFPPARFPEVKGLRDPFEEAEGVPVVRSLPAPPLGACDSPPPMAPPAAPPPAAAEEGGQDRHKASADAFDDSWDAFMRIDTAKMDAEATSPSIRRKQKRLNFSALPDDEQLPWIPASIEESPPKHARQDDDQAPHGKENLTTLPTTTTTVLVNITDPASFGVGPNLSKPPL